MKESMSWDLWALGMLCALVIFCGGYILSDHMISLNYFINKAMSSMVLTNMLLGAIGLILINKEK